MNLDRIGKYRVTGRIGEGAMGEVYKAHDPLLNRYVAHKTISSALASDPEFRRRFQREAQSAAQLNHPNVVTIFDFGEEKDTGLTYMAMELLEGVDLREAIRSRTLVHLGQKLPIMEQLCDGLAFAHAHGVVHRDLKPGNVRIQPGGQVKIVDFGLARLGASEMTRTGTVLGTPHYMSPEQVRGEKADARSDVFSLGAVFYEILTGRRAFDAPTMHEVLQAICDGEPEPLRRRAPDTPPALVALVERALAKKPEQRYADAGEMSQALTAARESLAGETLAMPGAGELEATLFDAAGSSIVPPAGQSRMSIAGATALSLRRARDGSLAQPGTMRQPATVAGGSQTHVPAPAPAGRLLLIGGIALGTLAVASGGLWLWTSSRSAARPAEAARDRAAETLKVDVLTQALITNKLELARSDLDSRDYSAAVAGAKEALKYDATNSEAQELLVRAERAQRALEKAVGDARGAIAGGDTAAAAAALTRILELDPRHPALAEISGQLDRHFRSQAEEARKAANEARAAADGVKAGANAAYTPARKAALAGDDLFQHERFAGAAQKYLEARNGFESARRDVESTRAAQAAEAARAAAAAAAQARAAASPTPGVVRGPVLPSPSAPPLVMPSVPPSPTAAPTAPAVAANIPTPSPTAALASRAGSPAEVQVQRVISDYVRAIETRDVALFKTLMPDMTADGEKKLKESFAAVKSYTVGLSVESIQVEGEQATVQVSRQDTINGRQQKALRQVFRLDHSGGAWRIASMRAQ